MTMLVVVPNLASLLASASTFTSTAATSPCLLACAKLNETASENSVMPVALVRAERSTSDTPPSNPAAVSAFVFSESTLTAATAFVSAAVFGLVLAALAACDTARETALLLEGFTFFSFSCFFSATGLAICLSVDTCFSLDVDQGRLGPGDRLVLFLLHPPLTGLNVACGIEASKSAVPKGVITPAVPAVSDVPCFGCWT
mmetsp:Transcript_3748/g.7130  ORF Transcript_3748/g.7130 Transcript_3748/m.7130 type:complete len:200 (-) Transcript_3748:139-738(-)